MAKKGRRPGVYLIAEGRLGHEFAGKEKQRLEE
jgi:hypothetical protein